MNLNFTVFLTGAIVMIFEILGARILAPYVGTSTFTWTSVIGVFLLSLSIGYFIGGRIADKNATPQRLSLLILMAALLIAITSLIKTPVLDLIQSISSDLRVSATLAAIILFAPASIFLGTVSPYAVKLKLDTLKTSGQTVGNLYAISTLGSIVGTFLAGFVLISLFGSNQLLIILTIVLAATSLLPTVKHILPAIIVALIAPFTATAATLPPNSELVAEIDTQYSHIRVLDTVYYRDNEPIRLLQMGIGSHSAQYLDQSKEEQLVFPYTRYYRLAKHFTPQAEKALIIGAGAYSYPRDFLQKFPEAILDVVEIDPMLTEISRKYFALQDDPRMNIIHQGGRTFLNSKAKEDTEYDLIFLDAYHSTYTVPHQLTTVETVQHLESLLSEDGTVLANIISAIEGPQGKFLRAEYHTFKEVFPYVEIYPTADPTNPEMPQNIMMIARKTAPEKETSSDPELNRYLQNHYTSPITKDLPILTDDFAPVDQYIMELL